MTDNLPDARTLTKAELKAQRRQMQHDDIVEKRQRSLDMTLNRLARKYPNTEPKEPKHD